jgi:DNA topoisomerase-1
MSKSLVIVESPTKVKTLKGFLGADFKIMGSKGHVRDLPKSGLAVDIEHDFAPDYQLLPDRKAVIDELRKAAKDVDTVYLASDPDREGEAIAWHIREALKLKNVRRIEFNEITKTAVQRALNNPREIDMDRVNAQQARRVLDRIIGYQLSPLLSRKISKGLSAGRVQSVAVRLICEREREIQAFKIEEYWTINALLSPKTEEFPFPAKLLTRAGKKVEIANEEQANELVTALRPLEYSVASVKRQEKRRNPGAPFITSTLQQEASKQLRFSAKKTMMVAQALYEGIQLGSGSPVGLITYMRTDSTTIAAEAQVAARELITQRFGPDFVPDAPPKYKNKKSAQEAHEAIRPSYVTHIPEEIRQYLNEDQFRLYRLIWRRFVASQMKPAVLDVTTVDITAGRPGEAGEFGLRASGAVIKFSGFLSVYEDAKDEDAADEKEADDENTERKLPALEAKQPLDLRDILPRQHFTQPPPRYTEATLVKAMEENGIGRPSTYAQTLSTIQDRGYTELEQRRFKPTELGFIVNDKLVQHFPEVVDIQFTAGVEEKLDEVEEGRQNWIKLLHEWYNPFSEDVKRAKTEMEKVGPVETDFDCPACGKKLLLRRGRFGEFFSCSDYPECKTSMNVGPEGEPVAREEKVAPVVEGIEPGATQPCEKCSKDMVVRTSRRGAFWGCTGFPKCRNTIAIEGAQSEPQVEETEHACPNCGKPLAQRRGRFGPFLGCTGYPECKTIVNLDKEGNPRWPVADAAADGDGTVATKESGSAKAATATKKSTATRGKKGATAAKSTTKATVKKPARKEAMAEVA